MQLPQPLLDSLETVPGFHREPFKAVHDSGNQSTSIRINPAKVDEATDFFSRHRDLRVSAPVPWTTTGYYLSQRPSFTFDPLFHAGCYYVQEASSMLLEQAFRQHADLSRPLRALDLCAAPGGKSTHLQSLLPSDSILVSNEVIRSRSGMLKENIIKWGTQQVLVTSNDPRDFSKLENYFDVLVIDAPCSGSGLFRREPEAIGEWSEANVDLCSQRQQRILSDSWPCLKEGGLLIYSTCSYSPQEDEDVVAWLLRQWSADILPLHLPPEWRIVESGGGYRCWPNEVAGEGFFLACFRKTGGGEASPFRVKEKATPVNKKEKEIIGTWIRTEALSLIRHEQTVYAWPQVLEQDMHLLLQQLRVIYSGTIVGELLRDKLIPAHSLALSRLVADNIPRMTLNYEQAIHYLRRQELTVDSAEKGWTLVLYQGHAIGWANVLPGRINNYYPKEWRILKDPATIR